MMTMMLTMIQRRPQPLIAPGSTRSRVMKDTELSPSLNRACFHALALLSTANWSALSVFYRE